MRIAAVVGYRPPIWLVTDSLHQTPTLPWLPQINGNGTVLQYLEDPGGTKLTATTSVTESNDGLLIGTFKGSYVGFLPYEKLYHIVV
jgi:hypothetical protein